MIKQDIGPRLYQYALAGATATFTPLFDRAAMVRRIVLNNVSANDLWTVTVGGRELMRFRMNTTGNQRLLLAPSPGSAYNPNFFDWCREALGLDPSIPVPQGLSCVVASVGGATADIIFEVEERDLGDVGPANLNHYQGQVFLLPIYRRLNAAAAAVGLVALDTQEAPAWVPQVTTGLSAPVGWMVEELALFHESGGVNTFSGAANHQSILQDIRKVKNGEQLFSRPTAVNPLNGIPNVGAASAAGSANTVFGQRAAIFPPFQLASELDVSVLQNPLRYVGGDLVQVSYDITGDVTGGASYANHLQVSVARVTRTAS